MDDALESISVLKAWVVGVLVIGILDNWKLAEGSNEHAGRKLVDQASGFISIDCGATKDYLDEDTGISYKSDTGFVDTGINKVISPEYHSSNTDFGQQLINLRSFPQGKNNCYTLKPEQGKSSNYLIRAIFQYGNYDKKNEIPTFELYVGDNYWTTVEMSSVPFMYFPDIIYVLSSDTIFICLINTGSGIPFISALELRPLDKSLYPCDIGALNNGWRYNLGTTIDKVVVRYKNDVYGRLWYTSSALPNSVPINTSVIDIQNNNDSYQLPSEVLRTAVQPSSGYRSLSFNGTPNYIGEAYVCFHFAEIAKLTQGKKREFIIDVNGGSYISEPITLDYLKPLSICLNQTFDGQFSFVISATESSYHPPILNAFELYRVIRWFEHDKPTNSRDDGETDVRTNRWRANKWWIWLIVAVGGIMIAFLCLLFYAKVKKNIAEGERKKKQKILLQELRGNAISSTVRDKVKKRNNDRQDSHELQIFSFETISAATRNFSTENKLGEGGFGPVYKGELYDGQKIAIKRLSRSSRQGLVEFKNEAILIAKLQHTNLVRLLGLCIEQEEKILIYEYMPNKSLDFFLFDSTMKSLLNWKKRFNIIEGIAQGLLYLHKYSRLRVIHRDLKASNILLDEDMNPKISDFGLARIFGLKGLEENTNRIVGTYGYMSPEYAINGIVSIKTDVFSYGVLLLEIVSSKKNNSCYHSEYPLNLIGYAWQLWNEGKGLELIDPTIIDESSPSSEILRCIHVGLLCVQDQAADRPTMLDVATMLSSEIVQLHPPKQPAYLINIVQEKSSEVSEIMPGNCSINDVTISEMKAR
ncbi:cysteine-rich receptor-like protein kinase 28 [Quercus robur]|uniref:cysteine-rich receptor-like protein kinase 28 n=1 Tax=Quercus robur TaxID=38942 RepID=UPI0021639A28|nr:cysteine-rich receptor-like protein kinase 28 [Quercus robur]